MTANQPPRIATWLLSLFGDEQMSDSIAGDLIEQYGKGRSRRWYYCQIMHATVFNRGAMFKVIATVVVLSVFATMLIVIDHDVILHPGDRMATLGRIGTTDVLLVLALLALRAVWRFSTSILRALYWPTVIATVVLGLAGTTQMLSSGADSYLLRVGAYVDVMCLPAAFSLWRTRKSVEKV